MTEMTAVVKNASGIHARPSHVLVNAAVDYPGEIQVESSHGKSDLRTIMGLMLLTLRQGNEVKISVSGPDEEAMCRKLVELFETEFNFRRRPNCYADPQAAESQSASEVGAAPPPDPETSTP